MASPHFYLSDMDCFVIALGCGLEKSQVRSVMTKLTNIPGARVLPQRDDTIDSEIQDPDFKQGFNSACDSIDNVHLEVDVEAMAHVMFGYAGFEQQSEDEKKFYIESCESLKNNIQHWARLVRK